MCPCSLTTQLQRLVVPVAHDASDRCVAPPHCPRRCSSAHSTSPETNRCFRRFSLLRGRSTATTSGTGLNRLPVVRTFQNRCLLLLSADGVHHLLVGIFHPGHARSGGEQRRGNRWGWCGPRPETRISTGVVDETVGFACSNPGKTEQCPDAR